MTPSELLKPLARPFRPEYTSSQMAANVEFAVSRIASVNPATGEVLGELDSAGPTEVRPAGPDQVCTVFVHSGHVRQHRMAFAPRVLIHSAFSFTCGFVEGPQALPVINHMRQIARRYQRPRHRLTPDRQSGHFLQWAERFQAPIAPADVKLFGQPFRRRCRIQH